ncbi:MAG: universal stress protein [Bradyrhizobium sp.]|nr:universal stress protein [Pseudomonadota bacterium]MDE2469604.1 universal stress protein [Bradyrhizobium sp.]
MPVQFTNLLAAIDGSQGGWRALDVAMTKAAGGSLAMITVGVALTGRELAEFRRAEGEGTDAWEVFAEQLLAEARRRVDRAAGKPARTLLRWGDPAEAIINAIAEEKFNAIVVGRRGRGQLAGLLLGSVSQKLAPCSSVREFENRASTSS